MKTTLSERGQTAVPARIRKRFGLLPGQKFQWTEDGELIYLKPISKDPVKAFRGSSKGGGLTMALLKERQKDRERERE
ncbi:MAG: AbrB/MazE/SpoVT family DNA-binding domain-containing protein [Patescibacteria group bacterium]